MVRRSSARSYRVPVGVRLPRGSANGMSAQCESAWPGIQVRKRSRLGVRVRNRSQLRCPGEPRPNHLHLVILVTSTRLCHWSRFPAPVSPGGSDPCLFASTRFCVAVPIYYLQSIPTKFPHTPTTAFSLLPRCVQAIIEVCFLLREYIRLYKTRNLALSHCFISA